MSDFEINLSEWKQFLWDMDQLSEEIQVSLRNLYLIYSELDCQKTEVRMALGNSISTLRSINVWVEDLSNILRQIKKAYEKTEDGLR